MKISQKLVGRVWGQSEHICGFGHAQPMLPSCREAGF